MTTIAIVAFDGVTDIDVFLHWDLLNRPATMFAAAERPWSVHLLGTAGSHVTAAGLRIDMHGTVDEARQADAVVHASGPATRDLMRDRAYLDRLALDPGRQLVASQCSGALILAASGALDGLTATTYPTARPHLQAMGVTFVAEPLVVHDRVATAAGCLAGVELDRWLLSRLIDPAMAEHCVNSAQAWNAGIESVS